MLVDLSRLPPPDIVEALEYESILADRKARLKALLGEAGILPNWNPDQESDPLVKFLEESAFREMLLRARVNDAARAVMLASATGADLDQIGARYNVARLVVSPGDPAAIPPVPRVMEADDRFRRRIQLAFEGFSTAGPVGAYRFHALSASADVKDCGISRPRPGEVLVTVLSAQGDGSAAPALLAAVAAALNHEKVRPLTDTVLVESAQILSYEVTAAIEMHPGPDADTVLEAARAAVWAYADSCHAVGALVALSGLDGALHRPGVKRVILSAPASDIIPSAAQAAYCTGVTLTVAP